MLLGSTLLEVAIGIVFVYLLLSLLCSALSELIEVVIKRRASDLEQGIKNLLDNPALAENFFKHPLIKSLGKNPSYIPARTFSLALWNLATTQAAKAQNVAVGVTQDLGAIRNLIISLDENQIGSIKTSLLTLIDEAGSDINRARTNIEHWYNDAMDRVSGGYKRRVQIMLVGIGLLAATLLNIDTINIVKALLYNDTLRASVVASAEDYAKANAAPSPSPSPAMIVVTAATQAPASTPNATPTVTPTDENAAQQKAEAEAKKRAADAEAKKQESLALERIDNIRGQINKLNLPIGWISKPDKPEKTEALAQYEQELKSYNVDPRRLPDGPYSWFLKILGIIITGLAVSQGAPFWFDLLNKIIVVRSTIKPHEKSQEQPSKDKPAPETTKKQEEGDGKEGKTKG